MIVLRTPGSGGINLYSISKSRYSTLSHGSTTTNTTVNPCYDSSSFSTAPSSTSRFQMDMVSRISQEVRTSTTTGRVQELRQAVSSHTYQPDAAEIAKRLLFLAEE